MGLKGESPIWRECSACANARDPWFLPPLCLDSESVFMAVASEGRITMPKMALGGNPHFFGYLLMVCFFVRVGVRMKSKRQGMHLLSVWSLVLHSIACDGGLHEEEGEEATAA